jgi:hypothetical protein
VEDRRLSRSCVIEFSAYAFVTIGTAVLEQQTAPDAAAWIGTCLAIATKATALIRTRQRRGRRRRDRR